MLAGERVSSSSWSFDVQPLDVEAPSHHQSAADAAAAAAAAAVPGDDYHHYHHDIVLQRHRNSYVTLH